jgi:hypothetical protein
MPLADTLLRLAEPPALYEARWTGQILAEVRGTLTGRFGYSPEKVAYRESAMRAFFPRAMVEDFEQYIPEMQNHPKDRHVLAAACRCQANYLVTLNLKDFPAESAEKCNVTVVGPSAFLKRLWAIDESLVRDRLRRQADDICVPVTQLLDRLANSAPVFVAQIRDTLD